MQIPPAKPGGSIYLTNEQFISTNCFVNYIESSNTGHKQPILVPCGLWSVV